MHSVPAIGPERLREYYEHCPQLKPDSQTSIEAVERCQKLDNKLFEAVDDEIEDTNEEAIPASPLGAGEESTKPWYLQVQDTTEESNPFAHRQKLPETPVDPPPILQPLLHHLSIDIGLDHLNILDLRNVDPPPAFGANLFMIFGTARSEKHLNVSADRLCRWLRTTHKLTPYADGLLGRNELKLKLRRKARRSKMLGAVGASDPGVPDDGTRTGWVCVNVGSVDDGVSTGEDAEGKQDFVGFGRRSEGAKIVIQMMTEEKRGELDLENLWQGVLRGSIKRQKAAAIEDTDTQIPMLVSKDQSARRQFFLSGMDRREHVRGFHSSARWQHADKARFNNPRPLTDTDDNPPWIFPESMEVSSDAKKGTSQAQDAAAAHHEVPDPRHVQSDVDAQAAAALEKHLAHIRSVPDQVALEFLGTGQEEKTSTDFLHALFSAMPLFPTIEHYTAQLDLHAYALHLSHPGYTKHGYWRLLLEAETSCAHIPTSIFLSAFDTILLAPHTLPPPDPANPDSFLLEPSPFPSNPIYYDNDPDAAYKDVFPLSFPDPPRTGHTAVLYSLALAFDVLDRHAAHNPTDPLPEQFLFTLNEAVSYPRFPPDSGLRLIRRERETLQHHLRQCVSLLHLSSPFPTGLPSSFPASSTAAGSQASQPPTLPATRPIPVPLLLALLTTHARTGNWQGFWFLWRAMALRRQPRTAEMYALLFSEVALTRDQVVIRRVLSEWVGDMEREDPVVVMDEAVSGGVLACLEVLGVGEGEGEGRRGALGELWERATGVVGGEEGAARLGEEESRGRDTEGRSVDSMGRTRMTHEDGS